MKLIRVPYLACLLACLAMSSLEAQNDVPTKIVENPYYPFKVNTTWTYKINSNDKVRDEKKLVFKVIRHERVGNTLCAVVEGKFDGKVLSTEDIGINQEGICRFKVGDSVVNPPLCLLKLPASTNSWKVEGKVKDETIKGTFQGGKEEATKVPLGTYPTVVSKTDDMDINGVKTGVTYYFAKDVGMVKQVIKYQHGTMPMTMMLELEGFEMGK
jgi:hypothetical protein